jgi:hypothetical protein
MVVVSFGAGAYSNICRIKPDGRRRVPRLAVEGKIS